MTPVAQAQLAECISEISTVNPARAFGDHLFEYIDLSAVNQDEKRITGSRRIPGRDAPSRARQVLAAGDVLVSTVRPNLNAVARVEGELDGAVGSTGFCVLRPGKHLDSGYLFQWVRSPQFVQRMVRAATGASYPAVSDRIVRKSMIPLPNISEQRQIARVLDAADALRVRRRQALHGLDLLQQSSFVDLFGDPYSAHLRWSIVALKDVCLFINDCPHSTPKWTDSGVLCLRTSNLKQGDWDWSEQRFVSESTYHERSRRGSLEPGEIVLSREGTVGVAAIVPDGMRACLGQRLVQVRPDPAQVTSEYLLRYLLSVLHPERIGRVMVGSTARHLNLRELRSLPIPIPPTELQTRFVESMRLTAQRRAKMERALVLLQALFASLQDRAFKGEL